MKNTKNAFPIVLWGNLDYLSDYLLPLSRAPPAQHFYHSSDPNSVPNNRTKVLQRCELALFHHPWVFRCFFFTTFQILIQSQQEDKKTARVQTSFISTPMFLDVFFYHSPFYNVNGVCSFVPQLNWCEPTNLVYS